MIEGVHYFKQHWSIILNNKVHYEHIFMALVKKKSRFFSQTHIIIISQSLTIYFNFLIVNLVETIC